MVQDEALLQNTVQHKALLQNMVQDEVGSAAKPGAGKGPATKCGAG